METLQRPESELGMGLMGPVGHPPKGLMMHVKRIAGVSMEMKLRSLDTPLK